MLATFTNFPSHLSRCHPFSLSPSRPPAHPYSFAPSLAPTLAPFRPPSFALTLPSSLVRTHHRAFPPLRPLALSHSRAFSRAFSHPLAHSTRPLSFASTLAWASRPRSRPHPPLRALPRSCPPLAIFLHCQILITSGTYPDLIYPTNLGGGEG